MKSKSRMCAASGRGASGGNNHGGAEGLLFPPNFASASDYSIIRRQLPRDEQLGHSWRGLPTALTYCNHTLLHNHTMQELLTQVRVNFRNQLCHDPFNHGHVCCVRLQSATGCVVVAALHLCSLYMESKEKLCGYSLLSISTHCSSLQLAVLLRSLRGIASNPGEENCHTTRIELEILKLSTPPRFGDSMYPLPSQYQYLTIPHDLALCGERKAGSIPECYCMHAL